MTVHFPLLRLSLLIPLLSLFAACAVIRVYDVKDTNAVFDMALTKADDSLAKASLDYDQKTSIWKEVQKNPPADKDAPLKTATDWHNQMSTRLDQLRGHQSKLHTLHKEFVHLAGDHKQISSNEAQWEPTQRLRQEFEERVQFFNKELDHYSKASNSFAKTLTANKLFAQVKPGDLVQRLNEVKAAIDKVDQSLGKDLDGKEQAYNKFKTRRGPTQKKRERELFLLIESMSEIRNQIQLKSQKIVSLRDNFAARQKGKKYIRSIDPEWDQVKQLKMDYTHIRNQVENLSKEYSQRASRFGLSLKEGTEETK